MEAGRAPVGRHLAAAGGGIGGGADVILPICGSASQGVIKAAQDAGKYLVFFDSDEYSRAPASILGCTALRQEQLAYAKLKEANEGRLAFGKAEVVGMKEGYIELLSSSPSYQNGVPQAVKARTASSTVSRSSCCGSHWYSLLRKYKLALRLM
jgi:simple sugar transport system substrate-binding protein